MRRGAGRQPAACGPGPGAGFLPAGCRAPLALGARGSGLRVVAVGGSAAARGGSSWGASRAQPWRGCLTPAVRASACCAEAAHEAVKIFEAPENAARVHEVQQQCAGDLGKFFMLMIPLATELVGSVIQKYGFEANQAGAMAFVAELQKHQGDAEIAGLVCVCAACVACARTRGAAGLVLIRAAAPARVCTRGSCGDTNAVVLRDRRTT